MFIKFQKIENTQTIPNTSNYFAKEKLDGSNIGIFIPTQGEIEFYSRNGNDFCEQYYEEYLNDFKKELEALRTSEDVYYFGELIAPQINRRIGYKKMQVLIYIKYNLKTREMTLVDDLPLKNLLFKTYNLGYDSIKLGVKSEFADDNLEGYVIYKVENGKIVEMFKYKDPKFSDVKPKKFNMKPLRDRFNDFLTENRIIDVISKNPNCKDISEVANALVVDAKEDFLKENNISMVRKNDQKNIFGCNKRAYDLIKLHLGL